MLAIPVQLQRPAQHSPPAVAVHRVGRGGGGVGGVGGGLLSNLLSKA